MTTFVTFYFVFVLLGTLAFFYACGAFERRMDAETHGRQLGQFEASAERSSVAPMEQPVAPVSLLNGPQIPVSSFSLLKLNPRLFVKYETKTKN